MQRVGFHSSSRPRFTLAVSWVLLAAAVVAAGFSFVSGWHRRARLDSGLWDAVGRGDLPAATALLKAGADPNTTEYRALECSRGLGWPAVLARLQGRKPRYDTGPPAASGDWTTRQKWNSLLWLAMERERPDTVRALLAYGARDQATGYLNTALMWAAARGDSGLVIVLLRQGSPIDATNDLGETALELAAAGGHTAVVKLLVRRGATDRRGAALRAATEAGRSEIIGLLTARSTELDRRPPVTRRNEP